MTAPRSLRKFHLNPWAKNINSFRMKYNHDFSAGRSIFPLQGGQIPPGQHRKAWRSGAMSCPDPLSLSARQGYPFLPRGLPEAHRGRSRAVSWTSRRQQSRLNMGEDRHDVTCAGAKVEEQVPRPGDELRPPVHDFLQYGLQVISARGYTIKLAESGCPTWGRAGFVPAGPQCAAWRLWIRKPPSGRPCG
jgi:hypothetical protein